MVCSQPEYEDEQEKPSEEAIRKLLASYMTVPQDQSAKVGETIKRDLLELVNFENDTKKWEELLTRSRIAGACERVERACKDLEARDNLAGLPKDEVIAAINHLLGPNCAYFVDDDCPHRKGYKAVLKKLLDGVPDMAWLRELSLNKKVARLGIDMLAEDNFHSRLASPAQICLWLLTGYNQDSIHRHAIAISKMKNVVDIDPNLTTEQERI